jgi:hypothetical protein
LPEAFRDFCLSLPVRSPFGIRDAQGAYLHGFALGIEIFSRLNRLFAADGAFGLKQGKQHDGRLSFLLMIRQYRYCHITIEDNRPANLWRCYS